MIRAAENAKSSKYAGSLLRPQNWRDALADLLPEEWAFDTLEDNTRLKPLNPQAWIDLAHAELQRGYYDDAIVHLSSAINIDPNSDQAFFLRGCAHLARREFNIAINDFTQAITLKPNRIDAYSQRGFAHERLLQYENAIHDHNIALIIKGRPIRAKPRRSISSAIIGKITVAVRDDVIKPAAQFIREKIIGNISQANPEKISHKKSATKKSARKKKSS